MRPIGHNLYSRMLTSIAIAVALSLFYIGMYPILIGGGVIYVYPYWSPAAAMAWVAGGIALQAWLCVRRRNAPRPGVFRQLGLGVLYAFSMVVLSGGCYQS